MGKSRGVRRFFEGFRGLDLRSSDLTRPLNFCKEMTNMEIATPFALQSRKGIRANSQFYTPTGALGGINEEVAYPTIGLHNYVSSGFDPVSNSYKVKEELIGLGNGLFKYQSGTFSIAYTGAGSAEWEFLPTTTGWIFDLRVNGVSQAGFPLNCNTGLVGSATTTLRTLQVAINAVANFNCILTPQAIVNGNQAAVGTSATPITVNAGHTFTVSTTQPTRTEIVDQISGCRICRDVIAVGATTLTLKQPGGGPAINVNNNDIIGVGLLQVTVLPETPAQLVQAVPTVVSFGYWERIYLGRLLNVGSEGMPSAFLNGTTLANQFNACFINAANITFFVTYMGDTGVTLAGGKNVPRPVNDFRYSVRPGSNLWKYDGVEVYGADLPPGRLISATPAAGGTMTVGRYKYFCTYQHIDAKGNIHEGAGKNDVYDQINEAFISPIQIATTSAGNQQVTLVSASCENTALFGALYRNYNTAVAANGGTQVYGTGSVAITVTAPHTMRVGNTACWINGVDGRIQRAVVTAVGNGTVTVTSTRAGNIANGSFITNNLTVRYYRTKADGDVFYLLSERPDNVTTAGATLTWTDDTPDSALMEQYLEGGPSRDNPPLMTWIANHQGIIVGLGDPQNQQAVYYCNISGDAGVEPENWDVLNEVNVTASKEGALVVCASDTDNMLAVFSKDSYFNLLGDFTDGSITIDSVASSDVGCPAPQSIKKIKDTLIYLSIKGFRALKAGQISTMDDRLVSAFDNQYYQQDGTTAGVLSNKLYYLRATATVDTERQRYICFIPAESPSAPNWNITNANSRCFVYDFANDAWGSWRWGPVFPSPAEAGLVVHKNQVYMASRPQQQRGLLLRLMGTGTRYDYIDNTYVQTPVLTLGWDLAGAPGMNQEPLWIKLYSLRNTTTFPALSILVEVFRNFLNFPYSFFTASFPTAIEATKKILKTKTNGVQFKFTCQNPYENMYISGYEYIIGEQYQDDNPETSP